MIDYTELETHIGIKFKDKTLLQNVFIHRSFLNEHKQFHMPSNEKLEFLGDSVLSLITSIYLYKNFSDLQEGDYTDIKAAIVRTESLDEAAKLIKLGIYLRLSKGEEQGEGRKNMNILADCFEALVAAIFIDQGFDKAYEFVLRHLFGNKLKSIVDQQLYLSPKSRLQEHIQAHYKILPIYKVHVEDGPEHKKKFTVGVYIKNKLLSEGSGSSKKQAEEQAAKIALENIG